MQTNIKPKYISYYDEDKLYLSSKLLAFGINKEIKDIILNTLYQGYLTIDEIPITKVFDNLMSALNVTHIGDSLNNGQKNMVKSSLSYLSTRYTIRKNRGEI